MSYFIALYSALEVDHTATEEEIKTAYKKMAKKFHPDLNKDEDAPKMMKKITFAYEILSDPAKKAEYEYEQREKRRVAQKEKAKSNLVQKRRKKKK